MSDDGERRIRPLSPRQARHTLAHRLGRVADRVRQIATNKGARPYRVYLRWTQWGIGPNGERGDGYERDVATVEILPTPLVTSMDSVSFSIFHSGVVPSGSLRVREISVRSFTEDNLRGLVIPDVEWLEGPDRCNIPIVADLNGTADATVMEPYKFCYEVVEDARHGKSVERKKFRLLSTPVLLAENAEFQIMLERISPDRLRDGTGPFALGQGR